MSTPENDESPRSSCKKWLFIGGVIAFISLCCICSLIWLAWTYGDSVVEALLNTLEITY